MFAEWNVVFLTIWEGLFLDRKNVEEYNVGDLIVVRTK
jgi:hypothetical protein